MGFFARIEWREACRCGCSFSSGAAWTRELEGEHRVALFVDAVGEERAEHRPEEQLVDVFKRREGISLRVQGESGLPPAYEHPRGRVHG